MSLIQRLLSLLGFSKNVISTVSKSNINTSGTELSINDAVPLNDSKEYSRHEEPCLYVRPETYPVLIKPISNVSVNYNEHIERTDKGVLEDYFFDYASKEIGEKFKNDIQVKLLEYTLTPDFAYIDTEQELYIAIEIDEPYTINIQKDCIPIHYTGLDDVKNKMYIQQGWHIIRFSEEQVAKYTNECVTYLSNVVKRSPKNCLLEIKCWSKEDALDFIKKEYRNSYLPIPFAPTNLSERKFVFRSFEISEIRGIYSPKTGKSLVCVEFKQNNTFSPIGGDSWISFGRCYINEEIFWNEMKNAGRSFSLNINKVISNITNCNYQIHIQDLCFEAVGMICNDNFKLLDEGKFQIVFPTKKLPAILPELTHEEKIGIMKKYGFDV